MYDYGTRSFLEAKKVNATEAIAGYLKKYDAGFGPKNYRKVNDFISGNWNRFATYIDRGIKSGEIKGKDIKLNTYFAEQKQYKAIVASEYQLACVTPDEEKLLKRIKKEYGVGFIQSYLQRNNLLFSGKDMSYFSKTLQWLPVVRYAIANGILNQPEVLPVQSDIIEL